MELEHSEIGGLRWGNSYGRAANATWPFAKLTATQSKLTIRLRFGPFGRTFEFERHEVRALRRKRALFSVGIVVDHESTIHPPFLLFWTFGYARLKSALEQLGYPVLEA